MKVYTNKIVAFFTLLVGLQFSLAQDVHFSQMIYSPLQNSPAMSGANSPMQAIVNYRSQWNSVAVPYSTIQASFDMRFNENKRGKKGIVAGGINFYNDRSGENRVTTNFAKLNLAYHLIIDNNNMIGVGIYGGYGQRTLDRGNEQWSNQYDGMAYDATLPNGETITTPSRTFMDAGAGFVYTYKANEGYISQNKHRLFNVGAGIYHVNRPNYSFNGGDERLPIRFSVFATGDIGIPNTRNAFVPGVFWNHQGPYNEILVGTYYKYTITEGSKITGYVKPFCASLGVFSRIKDALVLKAMLDWSDFTVGFAYDVNISKLTSYSNSKGGFELFLRYNIGDSFLYSRYRY